MKRKRFRKPPSFQNLNNLDRIYLDFQSNEDPIQKLANHLQLKLEDIRVSDEFPEYFLTRTGFVFVIDFQNLKIFEVKSFYYKKANRLMIYLVNNGKYYQKSVSRLIAKNFINHDVNHYYIEYKDGNIYNNNVDNLSLREKNLRRNVIKLSENDYVRILNDIKNGKTLKDCSVKWNVSVSRINQIKKRAIKYLQKEDLWSFYSFYNVQNHEDAVTLLNNQYEKAFDIIYGKAVVDSVEYSYWRSLDYRYYIFTRRPDRQEKRYYDLPDHYVHVEFARRNQNNLIIPVKFNKGIMKDLKRL